ncbi:hypothetical protein BGY98DRAFT_592382 [Russula aff. rugulosa BPL654]|nr:hypothetical protein BGY98DRAFT_592382 [Russula aff. rugulosa BPL654]
MDSLFHEFLRSDPHRPLWLYFSIILSSIHTDYISITTYPVNGYLGLHSRSSSYGKFPPNIAPIQAGETQNLLRLRRDTYSARNAPPSYPRIPRLVSKNAKSQRRRPTRCSRSCQPCAESSFPHRPRKMNVQKSAVRCLPSYDAVRCFRMKNRRRCVRRLV